MGFEVAVKERTKKRPGKPYFLMGLFTIIVLTLGAFLQEGIAFFNEPYNSLMVDLEFYCLFAVNAVVMAFYFILVFRYFRLKPNIPWIIAFALLIVGNTLAIYHFPTNTSGVTVPLHGNSFGWEYTLEEHYRLRYVLSFAAACVDLYIVFAVAPRIYRSARALSWILHCFVIITFIAVFYSIIKETEVYSYYLDPNQKDLRGYEILSFFNNRNTFAMVLLLAMAAIGILHSDSHHFWYHIMMGSLYIEMFFTLSKTGIITGTIYVFLFAFYRFGRNFSFHKVRAFVGMAIFLGLFASFIIIGHFQLMERSTIIVKLYTNFVQAMTKRMENGFLDYRVEIWQNCFSFLSGDTFYQAFGVGDINALVLLKYMWNRTEVDFYYTHNGFVHQIFAGGYLRLTVYLAMLIYFFVVVVVNITRKKRATFAYFLAVLILLVQGITETTSLLSIETKGMFFPLIFIVPMLVEFHKGNNEAIFEQQKNQFSKVKRQYGYALSPIRKALVATLPIMPVCLFFAGVIPFISSLKMIWFHEYNTQASILFCITLLLYCPISFYIAALHKGWRWIAMYVINYLVIFASLLVIFIRPFQINLVFSFIALAIFLAFLVLLSLGKFPRWWPVHLLLSVLPVAIVSVVFLGVNHYLTFMGAGLFIVDGEAFDSTTLNISILVGEMALFLLLTFGLMPRRLFGFPLWHILYRADNWVSALSQSVEDKVNLREEIHHGDYVGRYYKDQIKNWKY